MSIDLNDAELQKSGELIPDGTYAKIAMTIRPGGIDGQDEIDRGLLRASKATDSDVLMLDVEFTVTEGPHVRRKFWQMFTVSGGKVDEHGCFDRLEDLHGLLPRDDRQRARARSAEHERRREGEAHDARPGRPQRHHLHRQDQDRAQQRCALRRPQQARPCHRSERARMAQGDGRRGLGRRAPAPTHGPKAAASASPAAPAWKQPSASPPANAAPAWNKPAQPGTGPAAAATDAPAPTPAGPAWLNS